MSNSCESSTDIKYYDNYRFGMAGWICPKCGNIWSPTTPGCYNCNTQSTTWTTDTYKCSSDKGEENHD